MPVHQYFEQEIRDRNVRRVKIEGRGNSLVASRDIAPRALALFVKLPLMTALDIDRLQDTCYACLRSSSGRANFTDDDSDDLALKACSGCQTVRFCNRICQKLSWNHYHKYECKIFRKLHPRVLPSSARAIIRLLLKRKQGLVAEDEWKQLWALESHQDLRSEAGGHRWQDICLLAKAIKTYSGTEESLEKVLQLCCISAVNSFTLTNPACEEIGVILHPYPALINHSCTPNAYVRFDIPAPSKLASVGPDRRNNRVGTSLSVSALKAIRKGEEITISYIDPTLPHFSRLAQLSERYFFNCTCSLCAQGPHAVTDYFPEPTNHPSTTIEQATEALASYEPLPTGMPSEQQISRIRKALCLLSSTNCWPPHRHPAPHLRRHLLRLLITEGNYNEALLHAWYLAATINPVLYPPHHPLQLTSHWMLYHLSRQEIFIHLETKESLRHAHNFRALPKTNDLKLKVSLMIMTIKQLSESITPTAYNGNEFQTTLMKDINSGMGREEALQKEDKRQEDKKAQRQRKQQADKAGKDDTKTRDRLPPYIGPEEPPSDLPAYEETTNATISTRTKANTNARGGEDSDSDASDANDQIYRLRSTFGTFESFISKAFMDLMSGDGAMFWAEHVAGRLPSEDDVTTYMQGQVKQLLECERKGVAWTPAGGKNST